MRFYFFCTGFYLSVLCLTLCVCLCVCVCVCVCVCARSDFQAVQGLVFKL